MKGEDTRQLLHNMSAPPKTVVKYGDKIQLIHHDSNYYLSAKKSLAADIDKSCLMVNLMDSGSFQSIWYVLPSVNHKKQGDIVR